MGGRNGDVKPLVILVGLGGSDPKSLIGLEIEIPRLIEGADDVVVGKRGGALVGEKNAGGAAKANGAG